MLTGPFVGDLFLANRLRDNFEMLFLVAALANAIPLLLLYFLRPTVNEGSRSSLRLSDFVQITRRHWPGSILLVDFAFGVCMTARSFVASFIDRESLDMPGISVIMFLSSPLVSQLLYGFRHGDFQIELGQQRFSCVRF